jgi:hypothetical protein
MARQLGGGNRLPAGAVETLEGLRGRYGYPPPSCVACPDCGHDVPVAEGDRVMLTRSELVDLITQAVEREAQRN